MDQRLGDKILKEYMNGTSKKDIVQKLKISSNTFDYWEKINKNELARVDDYLERQRLKHVLKIQNVNIPVESDEEDDEEDGEGDDNGEGDEEAEVEEEKVVYHYDHHKFLHKEPAVKRIEEAEDVQQKTMVNRRLQIQEKINKLNDLHSRNVIGTGEYIKAADILHRQLSL